MRFYGLELIVVDIQEYNPLLGTKRAQTMDLIADQTNGMPKTCLKQDSPDKNQTWSPY